MITPLAAFVAAQDTSRRVSLPPTPVITIQGVGAGFVLEFGATRPLTARSSDGEVGLLWSSTDEAVVTVSQTGLVTHVGAGTAAVVVTHPTRPEVAASVSVQALPGGDPVGPPIAAFSVSGTGYRRTFVDESTEHPTLVTIDIDGDRRVLGQTPKAEFTRQVVGRTVTVFDTSKHRPTSGIIDWGDGTQEAMNMGASLQHIFATNGAKTITLFASNDYGSDSTSQVVEVELVAPIANFSVSMYGRTATVVDTSTKLPDTLMIDWGDGSAQEAIAKGGTLQHTYAVDGPYTITLTATNAVGLDTHSENVTAANAVSGAFLSLTPLLNDSGISAGAQFQVDNLTQSVEVACYVNGVLDRVDEIKIGNLHGPVYVYNQADCAPLDTLKVYKYITLAPGDVVRFDLRPYPQPGLQGTPGPLQTATVTLNQPFPGEILVYGICRLPRIEPQTAMPDLTGAVTIRVGESGDVGYDYTDLHQALQQAVILAATQPVILKLKNGGKWVGTFRMYNNAHPHWVVVQPEDTTHLPGEGVRFRPSVHDPDGTLTPWLLTNGGGSTCALRPNGAGVNRFRWIGVGFGLTADNTLSLTGIIRLDLSPTNLPTDLVSHICFDRCWIEGKDLSVSGGGVVRGIYAAGSHIAVVGCHIAKIESDGSDTQAVGGVTGPGPWLVENCFLEATGENIMVGGGNAAMNLIPEDLTFRGNHIYKPLKWFPKGGPLGLGYDGAARTIKNLFEIKHGRRILFENNVCDGFVRDDQDAAINIKLGEENTNNEMDACDIVIRWNKVINLYECSGIALSGRYGMKLQDNKSAYHTRRIAIYQNFFKWEDTGLTYGEFLEGPNYTIGELFIDHNTFVGAAHTYIARLVAAPATNLHWNLTNNIFGRSTEGIKALGVNLGAGHDYPNEAEGTASLADATVERDFAGNLFTTRTAASYPPDVSADNGWPASIAAIEFENEATGNYRLKATSPYRVGGGSYTGTDGANPGPDHDALDLALAGVV